MASGATTLVTLDLDIGQFWDVNAARLTPSAKSQCVSRHDAGVARRILLATQPSDERAEVLGRCAADRAGPRFGYLVGRLQDDLLAGGIARQEA